MAVEKIVLSKRCKKRELLLDNKRIYSGPENEFSVYDTYTRAKGVKLDANQLLYCGMVSGKKIMRYFGHEEGRSFLPHESFVIPAGRSVEIDFPEANDNKPTTCLSVHLSKERIRKISERMQDLTTLDGLNYSWEYQPNIIHVHHTSDTQGLLEKLASLFNQNDPDKEILLDFTLSELCLKLLREQGRKALLDYCHASPDATSITAALHFLEQNYIEPLDLDMLCSYSYLSRSKLYNEFKKQLGCSPGAYHQQLRLKAAADALRSGKSVTEVCYAVGFRDPSHFCRRFLQFFGVTPRNFRLQKSG